MTTEPEGRILIACIGNIFAGDDGFGVEVAHALASEGLPQHVTVIDYGIRGLDLAYALTDSWQAIVLVDAVARGGSPGDLYLLRAGTNGQPDCALDPHSMDIARVFALARSLDEIRAPVYVVGCEPGHLDDEAGGTFGLSPAVAAAIPEAVRMIGRFVRELAGGVCKTGISWDAVTT